MRGSPELRDEMVDTLRELVRIPSITGNEGTAQEFMYRQYEALHLKNIRLTAQREKIENHPAFCGANKPYDGRPNIIGIWEGDPKKKSIILNGHIDTVSPEPIAQWKHPPFSGEVEGNRLYGRGALDMKAGLIANLFAVKVLKLAGIDPGGTVILQSVIEEEEGGGGGALCLFPGGLHRGWNDCHGTGLVGEYSLSRDCALFGQSERKGRPSFAEPPWSKCDRQIDFRFIRPLRSWIKNERPRCAFPSSRIFNQGGRPAI